MAKKLCDIGGHVPIGHLGIPNIGVALNHSVGRELDHVFKGQWAKLTVVTDVIPFCCFGLAHAKGCIACLGE